MSVKNKQNSSVNFLVRAEFLIARPADRPPLVITIPHSLNGSALYTELQIIFWFEEYFTH